MFIFSSKQVFLEVNFGPNVEVYISAAWNK